MIDEAQKVDPPGPLNPIYILFNILFILLTSNPYQKHQINLNHTNFNSLLILIIIQKHLSLII